MNSKSKNLFCYLFSILLSGFFANGCADCCFPDGLDYVCDKKITITSPENGSTFTATQTVPIRFSADGFGNEGAMDGKGNYTQCKLSLYKAVNAGETVLVYENKKSCEEDRVEGWDVGPLSACPSDAQSDCYHAKITVDSTKCFKSDESAHFNVQE